jgi:phosphoglycolate phosphatase-like HAD superfamily hydrolase
VNEPRDVMAATQAGYGAKVAVATGPATFGYLRDHPEHQPDFVIRSMGDLIGLIDRLKSGDDPPQ